jgi:hypothetical protein
MLNVSHGRRHERPGPHECRACDRRSATHRCGAGKHVRATGLGRRYCASSSFGPRCCCRNSAWDPHATHPGVATVRGAIRCSHDHHNGCGIPARGGCSVRCVYRRRSVSEFTGGGSPGAGAGGTSGDHAAPPVGCGNSCGRRRRLRLGSPHLRGSRVISRLGPGPLGCSRCGSCRASCSEWPSGSRRREPYSGGWGQLRRGCHDPRRAGAGHAAGAAWALCR